jgi:hypothetical protein
VAVVDISVQLVNFVMGIESACSHTTGPLLTFLSRQPCHLLDLIEAKVSEGGPFLDWRGNLGGDDNAEQLTKSHWV